MRLHALVLISALAYSMPSIAHASAPSSTCTVQYAQSSEPSTDDTIGECLYKSIMLSIISVNPASGKVEATKVDELIYTDVVDGYKCTINERKERAAIDALKVRAAALQEHGDCDVVELLL